MWKKTTLAIAALITLFVSAVPQLEAKAIFVVDIGGPPLRRCSDIPIGDSDYDVKDAIRDSGDVFLNFDDDKLKNIAFQYISSPWKGDFTAGYGIYAMIRAAISHRSDVSSDTRFYIGCVLRDIRVNPESSLNLSCGGLGDSCAEEYMGRALAWAAHDGWLQNTNYRDGRMLDNVNIAFALKPWNEFPGQYSFMWYWYGMGEAWNVLFNHQTESPVYAMLTIGHLNHIRRMYQEANVSAPDFSYLRDQVEETIGWIQTKIEPSSFLFKETACGRTGDPWGEVCNCADRQGPGVGGVSCNVGGLKDEYGNPVPRHPHHYPMMNTLGHLQVASYLQWPWTDPGFISQQCSPNQGHHNWVFNCLFS